MILTLVNVPLEKSILNCVHANAPCRFITVEGTSTMCQAKAAALLFDPSICPLLKDLPLEEQAVRMRDDRRIRACIEALSKPSGGAAAEGVGRKLDAYHSLAAARSADAPG